MNASVIDNAEPTGAERRTEARLAPDRAYDITVWTGQEGILTDESHSGLSLAVKDATGLRIGQRIEISYRGDPVTATVRNVQLMENHLWRVGLECADPRLCNPGT